MPHDSSCDHHICGRNDRQLRRTQPGVANLILLEASSRNLNGQCVRQPRVNEHEPRREKGGGGQGLEASMPHARQLPDLASASSPGRWMVMQVRRLVHAAPAQLRRRALMPGRAGTKARSRPSGRTAVAHLEVLEVRFTNAESTVSGLVDQVCCQCWDGNSVSARRWPFDSARS